MRDVETRGRTDHGNRVAWLSLLLSGGLLAVKFLAYQLTGSAAVLSDALESIVNVIASSFALFSVTLSARPPDASHPYGHGRVEFFSAGFEGALIMVAAVAILGRRSHGCLLPNHSPGYRLVWASCVVPESPMRCLGCTCSMLAAVPTLW